MDLATLRKHWNEWGRRDPLWAVLSDESRRGGRWDPAEFFQTGQREVDSTLRCLATFGLPVHRRRALDFGCGVGRITQALSERFESCVGVDVASSMIREAERFNRHGDRCRYVLNERPDLASFDDDRFDLVYTNLVLQHMSPALARGYLAEFLRIAAPGGFVVFQLPSHPGDPGEGLALPAEACSARLELREPVGRLAAGQVSTLALRVTNTSALAWPALETTRFPLRVGNCWRDPEGHRVFGEDGRVAIPGPVESGAYQDVDLVVHAPDDARDYVIECDVVQEFVTWFRNRGNDVLRVPVTVMGAPAREAGGHGEEPGRGAIGDREEDREHGKHRERRTVPGDAPADVTSTAPGTGLNQRNPQGAARGSAIGSPGLDDAGNPRDTVVADGVVTRSEHGEKSPRIVEGAQPRTVRGAWRVFAAGLRSRLRPGTGAEEPRMEMHGVPRGEVEELIRDHGGRLLAVHDDFSAPGFISFRYFVTRI